MKTFCILKNCLLIFIIIKGEYHYIYSNLLFRRIKSKNLSNYILVSKEEFINIMHEQQGLGLLESSPEQLYEERKSRIVKIWDNSNQRYKLFYTSKFMSEKFPKNILERIAYALSKDFVNVAEVKYVRYSEVKETQLGAYMKRNEMNGLLLVRLSTDYKIEELPQKENSIEGLIAFWTFLADPEHFVIWDRMDLNKNVHVFSETKAIISYDHDESHILWPTSTLKDDEAYFYSHCIVWKEFFREELSGIKIKIDKIYEMADKLYNFYKDPENLYKRIRSAGFNPDSAFMRIITSKLLQRIKNLRQSIDKVLDIIGE